MHGYSVGSRAGGNNSLTPFPRMKRLMEYHMILFLVVGTEPIVSHEHARQASWAVLDPHYIANDYTELLVFLLPLLRCWGCRCAPSLPGNMVLG